MEKRQKFVKKVMAPKVNSNLPAKCKNICPLKDRDFQVACGKNIIEFLVRNIYPHPISLHMLLTPEIKTFWQIINFTVKHIDPSFKCSSDSELQHFSKWLGYHYSITPAVLAGFSHQWGQLLAFASWLVDAITQASSMEKTLLSKEEEVVKEYLFTAYHCFLEDKPYEPIRTELLDTLETISFEYREKQQEGIHQISQLNEEKTRLSVDALSGQDEQIQQLLAEKSRIVLEMSQMEEKRDFLQDKNRFLWAKLAEKFGVERIDENLPHILNQRLQQIEDDISQESQVLRETQETVIEITSQLTEAADFSLKRDLENSIREHTDLQNTLAELKSSLSLYETRISSLKVKKTQAEKTHSKTVSATRQLIMEDTQFISQHARKIAGWLENLTVGSN